MSLEEYGFDNAILNKIESENIPNDTIVARVTAAHKERYELICEKGSIFGKLKTVIYYKDSKESFPTTGDFVLIVYNENGDSQIVKTLERKTFFARRDKDPTPGRGEQAVAANFDYVFIMESLNHDFNLKRTERYLTLAWQSGATPVIILTKADLVDDYSQQLVDMEQVAMGVDIFVISTVTGQNMNKLRAFLKPKQTIVFLGSSGVGKSTLVNALADEVLMSVNTIREDDSKGRHTTTYRQLIMLKSGVMIIDTPGMRELGMWDVTQGIGKSFSDVEQFLGKCRFADCKHKTEPGCAIKTAIESGELSQERYDDYCKLKREAIFSNDKGGYNRAKGMWGKDIAKAIKEKKKSGEIRR